MLNNTICKNVKNHFNTSIEFYTMNLCSVTMDGSIIIFSSWQTKSIVFFHKGGGGGISSDVSESKSESGFPSPACPSPSPSPAHVQICVCVHTLYNHTTRVTCTVHCKSRNTEDIPGSGLLLLRFGWNLCEWFDIILENIVWNFDENLMKFRRAETEISVWIRNCISAQIPRSRCRVIESRAPSPRPRPSHEPSSPSPRPSPAQTDSSPRPDSSHTSLGISMYTRQTMTMI